MHFNIIMPSLAVHREMNVRNIVEMKCLSAVIAYEMKESILLFVFTHLLKSLKLHVFMLNSALTIRKLQCRNKLEVCWQTVQFTFSLVA